MHLYNNSYLQQNDLNLITNSLVSIETHVSIIVLPDSNSSYAKVKKIYEYLSIFVIYGIVYNTKNNLKNGYGKK